ncbi:uncharacterized protein LOC111294624 [Durio zibethinus]|uniref:Uncharacterized protein LOC111294624 n=1 Tax=Durio zibethinus TaxID=66656 RepID=A0A6P5YTE7_DURZI|nr:uncharacterized protein LOC111294624 [Durio zibethinus]
MDIKPFLHKHYLLFDHYNNQDASCDKCNQKIDRWAYNCETCNFWLHSACAEQQLPPQISHSFHSQHPLTLYFDVIDFICDKCFTLSRGHRYHCNDCNLEIDVSCAAHSTHDETVLGKKESRRSDSRYRKIDHFVHRDRLTGIFNYRKVGKKHRSCGWCEKHLSGMCYGCFECFEKFYIHETCLSNIPTKILGHPFHTSHPLYIQPAMKFNNSKPCCNACKDEIVGEAYRCQKCQFSLHVLCSRLQPSLKHEIHDHGLSYFEIKHPNVTYQCNMCDKNIGAKYIQNRFYRCVQCDFNFHLKCLEILPSVIHKYHRHTLILVNRFREDDSGEYFCDICEEERKPKHPIYCCKNCTYIAHIQCALNKVDSKVLKPELIQQEEAEKGNEESQKHDLERQIEHFTHQHSLNYYEVIEKKEDLLCKACNLEINGEGYGCESCEYYLHKTCAKLSYEVLHPLHTQHPLKLFAGSEPFLCEECRDFSVGFMYVCYLCSFIVDVKCATIKTHDNESQRRKEMGRESKLCLFSQDHELYFLNFSLKPQKDFKCSICFLLLSGPIQYCIRCHYFLHESCLGFPREIQLSLIHPEHPLHPIVNKSRYAGCLACRVSFDKYDIVYNCEECEFYLHLSCANSLRRALESKLHKHPLFYFGTECQELFMGDHGHPLTICNGCKYSLGGVPFYRCILCCLNFHLACVLIPHFIKSKCHIHPLTLRDCFVEDDSGEYYCDICEEERLPKDHIYFCEECGGLFVAHIECVLNYMEEEMAAAEKSSSNLILDFENTSRQAENEVSTDDSKEEEQSNSENSAMEASTEEQQSD